MHTKFYRRCSLSLVRSLHNIVCLPPPFFVSAVVILPTDFPGWGFARQHPFGSKAKSKNVTVNFISRKGAMHLSWGGKSGVLLETIFGVTKGITTDVRNEQGRQTRNARFCQVERATLSVFKSVQGK